MNGNEAEEEVDDIMDPMEAIGEAISNVADTITILNDNVGNLDVTLTCMLDEMKINNEHLSKIANYFEAAHKAAIDPEDDAPGTTNVPIDNG